MSDSSIEVGALSNKGKLIALIAGPLLALVTYYALPESYLNVTGDVVPLSHAARACMAVTTLMAIWWFSEALPIAATAMIPIVAYPLLQISSAKEAMSDYASGTIFLFLGGFLLAAAIHRWHLDRRIALRMLAIFGTRPNQMVLGLMVATATLSAWVSNTATAAMMVPIAIAVMSVVRSTQDSPTPTKDEKNFSISLLLAIAYAASIGGMATIIGSPPNGIFARFVEQTYNHHISFAEWLAIGLPVTVILLPLSYLLLTKIMYRNNLPPIPGGQEWVKRELGKLGKMSRGEKIVLTVFLTTAFLWVFGPQVRDITIGGAKPFSALSDTIIAMLAGVTLFIIPVDAKRGVHALDWTSTKDVVAWDVLLLFGGGLTMAAALQKTGAAALVGAQVTALGHLGDVGLLSGVVGLVVFATEVTSNTALAATMMPLVNAASSAIGVAAEPLLFGTAIAASCAFMMPVATPPNAIVFGTGRLHISDMVKAGFILNVISIVVIVAVILVVQPTLPTP